jgi:formimidoylglutamate deiminase
VEAVNESLIWAPRAWLDDGWAEGVLLGIDAQGRWSEVRSGVVAPPANATPLQGPALPGLVDAHSHAFQRAFAGLAERREAGREHDDFWSWRERMYAVAARITPEGLRAIAAHLYVELLRGGFTQVCEFHYLQQREDGRPYDDPLALSFALADAASDAGIGLTVLPALYERAGFGAAALAHKQRRFALDADGVWRACERIAAARRPLVEAGLALHSLRAAAPASIARLRTLAEGFAGPIHIHVAEQRREVRECLAATGARPLEWLARESLLDARWQLVHATHVTREEIDAVAAARAGVVLCPSTEANLGDGLTDLPAWLDAGSGAVRLALGSDSNATRGWREELRWLEYGQRLSRETRNVAAGIERGVHRASGAARLFQRAVEGGAAAAFGPGAPAGLKPGARADLLVVDLHDAGLLGLPHEHLLDALVFSSPGRPWRDVMVGGRFVVREHRHANAGAIAARFESAMQALWSQG